MEPPLQFFTRELNGKDYGTGASVLSGMLGRKVFHENFSLEQTLHPEDHEGSFFDCEGAVNDGFRYTLVDNGILVSPYTDKKTAAMYDLPYTGSSWAAYDGVPQLSCFPLRAAPGKSTIRELLAGRPGILVMEAAGGDFTSDGNFATPVQLAFLFDGEKLTGKLPELLVSGSAFRMFGEDFIGVSSDNFPRFSRNHLLACEADVAAR
jgi:PmbA protein